MTSLSTRDRMLHDVARRLQRVCCDMPDAEFAALVAQIVDIELRYQARMETDASAPAPDASVGWRETSRTV